MICKDRPYQAKKYYYDDQQINSIIDRPGSSNLEYDTKKPIDVTDILDQCQHLKVEDGFRILYFCAHSLDGPYGVFGAVQEDLSDSKMEDSTAAYNSPHHLFSQFGYTNVIDPYEVIYGDRSPDSFLEAYGLRRLFDENTYVWSSFEKPRIIFDKSFSDNGYWQCYEDIEDYRPFILFDNGTYEFRFFTKETHEDNAFIMGKNYNYIARNIIKFEPLTGHKETSVYPKQMKTSGIDDELKFRHLFDYTCKNSVSFRIAKEMKVNYDHFHELMLEITKRNEYKKLPYSDEDYQNAAIEQEFDPLLMNHLNYLLTEEHLKEESRLLYSALLSDKELYSEVVENLPII